MNKKLGSMLVLFFLVTSIVFIAVLFIKLFLSSKNEDIVNFEEESYTYNINSILALLERNTEDSFTLSTDLSDLTSPDSLIPVRWVQADYLKISRALIEQYQKNSLDTWKLHSMFFRANCSEVKYGFQYASFDFFKTEGNSRYVIKIFIEPRKETVLLHYTEYSPLIYDWDFVDLEKMQITADDALQISEKNDGFALRHNYDNKCRVFDSNSPGSLIKGWQVIYSSPEKNSPHLLDFTINENNGEFERVYP